MPFEGKDVQLCALAWEVEHEQESHSFALSESTSAHDFESGTKKMNKQTNQFLNQNTQYIYI